MVGPGTATINGLEEVPLKVLWLWSTARLVLKDPFVNASKIRVTSKDWIVTLEGLVSTETMKQMAERDTWCVLGVKEVFNRIEVRP
jgi:hypothetical protein